MGVGQTSLVERRGPQATPEGIIRWRVSCTKDVRQKEAFRKLTSRMLRAWRRATHPKNQFRQLKFQAGTGGTLAYNAGDETAGPRQSNPEAAERI
jgi:hypothetical protein